MPLGSLSSREAARSVEKSFERRATSSQPSSSVVVAVVAGLVTLSHRHSRREFRRREVEVGWVVGGDVTGW